jgi:hypothetical protein
MYGIDTDLLRIGRAVNRLSERVAIKSKRWHRTPTVGQVLVARLQRMAEEPTKPSIGQMAWDSEIQRKLTMACSLMDSHKRSLHHPETHALFAGVHADGDLALHYQYHENEHPLRKLAIWESLKQITHHTGWGSDPHGEFEQVYPPMSEGTNEVKGFRARIIKLAGHGALALDSRKRRLRVNTEERWADFVCSTPDLDRQADRLNPNGADITDFAAHPIALRDHNVSRPIGRWENPATGECTLRIQDGKLLGRLFFFNSPDGDEALNLASQGGLAASIGFSPAGNPRRNEYGGMDYNDWILHEVSLVALPANQHALAMTA